MTRWLADPMRRWWSALFAAIAVVMDEADAVWEPFLAEDATSR